MANPQTSVNITVDYSDPKNTLVRDADRQSKAAASVITNNLRGLSGSFNGVNAGVRQFDQQLERANKRVLALGASVTILYGTVNAFKQLVSATAQVEKNLASINSIFQLSTRELDKFGKSLLNVAQQTGQSLDEVSEAAQEFSRQGLSVEETAKRTRDAMILVRLTGIDAKKAVDGLTATMSTFGKTGTDTTQIINKLVAVDRSFATSAGGLVDAFTRVGSVVEDAGVSLDQFIGLVTAARQITSRSEAVIGNSLKTIFTRLERSTTLDQLESFGIAVRDASGAAKNSLQVFNELANSYGNLGKEQQAQVNELAAGVFQVNQFTALVKDLAKANGIAAQATNISTQATNEAIIANASLNNTLSTSLQNLQSSAKVAASVVGNLAITPALKGAVNSSSFITDYLAGLSTNGTTGAAEDFGKYLGESILKGLGSIIAGPGSIFAARVITGLFARTLREVTTDVGQAANLGSSGVRNLVKGRSQEETSLQTVNGLLDQATAKEQRRFMAAKSVAEQEAIILGLIQRQVAVGSGSIGVASVLGRRTPRAAGGYIPMGEESAAIAAGVGGAPASARPVYLPSFNRGGGARGIVANTSEWMVPGAAGGAIYNRDMIRKNGLPPGAVPVAAGGYIPNMAKGGTPDYSSPSYYQNLGFGGQLGPSMPTPEQWAAMEQEKVKFYQDAFQKAQVEADKQHAIEVKQTEIKQKQLEQMAKQLDTVKRSTGYSAAELKLVERQNERLRQVEMERYEAAGLMAIQTKQAMEAKFANNNASPETMSAFMRARAASAGMGGAYSSWINSRNTPYGPQLPPGWTPPAGPQGSYRGLSEAETVRRVYRQGVVEDKRGSRQGEIVSQNKRLESLREKLQESAERAKEQRIQQAEANIIQAQARKELEAREAANKRDARLNRTATGVQYAGIALSLGSGFLPEGKGGTGQGQFLGATSGGAQGFGIGAGIGSIFGPMGTQIGALIGTLVGSVKGFVDKSTKSFAELAEEIDQSTKKSTKEFEKAVEVFQLQSRIEEALKDGNKRLAETLQGQRGSALAALAPEYRSFVGSNLSNPEGLAELNRQFVPGNQRTNQGLGLLLTLKGAATKFGASTGFAEATKEEKGQASEVIASLIGSLSKEELENLRKLAKGSPAAALTRVGKLGGLENNQEFLALVSRIGDRRASTESGLTAVQDVAQFGLFDAINRALSQSPVDKAQKTKDAQTAITRQNLSDLAAQIRTRANFGSIEFSASQQIEATRQQIALSNPALTESQRLAQTGAFGARNIAAQTGAQRADLFLTGKADLTELLSQLNPSNKAREAVAGVSDVGGLRALRDKLLTPAGQQDLPKLGGPNSSFFKSLVDLIRKLDELDKTETENTRASNESNKLLREQITFRNSLAGAQAEDIGSIASAEEAIFAGINRRDPADVMDSLRVRLREAEALQQFRATGDQGQLDASRFLGGLSDANKLSARENSALSRSDVETMRVKLGLEQERQVLTRKILDNEVELRVAKNQGDEERIRNALAEQNALLIERRKIMKDINEGQVRMLRAMSRVSEAEGNPFASASEVGDAQMGLARERGLQGDSLGSFTGGATSVFSEMRRGLMDLSEVGQQVGNSLKNNLGNAFGDFVTGAQKGKDAFRSFILGVLNDSARAFASKAVQQLLGMAFQAFSGSFINGMDFSGASATPVAGGGFVGLAAGGGVPAMLMGGEYVFGPKAASKLGSSMLTGLNKGTIRKMASGGALVTGGSGLRDDVPASLAPGSFVVRKAMTERYGVPMLASLASAASGGSFAGGGMVDSGVTATTIASMMANAGNAPAPIARAMGGFTDIGAAPLSRGTTTSFSPMPIKLAGGGMVYGGNGMSMARGFEDGGAVTMTAMPVNVAGASGGGGTFNIGVTINDNSTSSSSTAQGGGSSQGGASIADKQFGETLAARIKQVALQTIEEQTRMGGMLRRQSIRNQ